MKIFSSFAISLLLSSSASSASLSLPFNTGVMSSGSVAPGGSIDPNYSSKDPSVLAFVLSNPAYWAWIGPDSTSAWIGPDPASGGDFNGGVYTVDYTVTFDIVGYDPSSVVLAGQSAVDNTLNNILVNGVSTGITSSSYGSWSPFKLNSGFVSGKNTIDFDFGNLGGPGGLRVEFAEASGTPTSDTPELPVITLVGSGVAFLGLFRRRSRK